MSGRAIAIGVLFAQALWAMPRLRITTAIVGPINVAVGSNGPQQTVGLQNIGDSTLNLTADSSVSWITTAISGASLQINLQTAPLARGTYSGVITLNDPNAIDVPQTVAVAVQIGGGAPDRVDFVMAPGGSAQADFRTGCAVTRSVSQPLSGLTLSLAMEGTGSFNFLCHYTLSATTSTSQAPGSYSGSFTINGSNFAADNRTVPVGIQLTLQPIAQAVPNSLQYRAGQRASPQSQFVQISNGGLGNLGISSVTTKPPTGAWLAAMLTGQTIQVTADPAGLAPGAYLGTVTVGSNAANASLAIPVELDVLASGPPVVPFGNVVDNATFTPGDPLAPGDIVALFGDQLTVGPPKQAAKVPLDTTIGGATVFLNNESAPLFYVSPNQIDFQIPYDAPSGDVQLRVDRDGLRGNTVTIPVIPRSPRIPTLPFGNYAIAVNASDQSFVIPVTPGISGHPAKAGDTITIYAIGLGSTSPAVASGATPPFTEPLARVDEPMLVYFNRGIFTNYVSVTPQFAGLTPGFVGLYQINVVVPVDGLKGDSIPLYLLFANAESNHVNVALQ